MPPKIHVIAEIVLSAAQRARLVSLGTDFFATSNPSSRTDTAEILNRVGDAELVLTSIAATITAPIIAKSPNLKFIQTWSTGVDNIDLAAARDAGITVCNVPDFSVESVAENTLGLMILSANRLVEANQHALTGGWDFTRFVGRELKGKTLLIVGYGRIGKRVGELAAAFGMKIRIARSSTAPAELCELFAQADFVTLHCPYTPSTRHLISDAQFECFRRGVIFINSSRGGVVDEGALFRALESGKVSSATLDVFEHEPPHPNHPLLHHKNVFVTPHSTWNTEESLQRLTDSAIDGIAAFLKGKPVNQVLHD